MIQPDAAAGPDALVTTVIPTYRRPALLRRAIDSVLRQTAGVGRVAVYDNASGDETGTLVMDMARRDPRVDYHVQPANLGPFENFRSGLAGVSTPFFSLLSDDDLVLPSFYETALHALRAYPTAMFAVTRVLQMDQAGRLLDIEGSGLRPGFYDVPQGLLAMIRLGYVTWTGTLFRREVIQLTGGFDAGTAAAFDLDFALRLAARFPFVMCERIGGVYVAETSAISVETSLAAWDKIIDNIGRESSLPASIRGEAQEALRQQLAALVYRIGRAAARQARLAEAQGAARVLRERFADHGRARLIDVTVQACRRVPVVVTILATALSSFRVLRSTVLHLRLGAADRRVLRSAGIG